MTAGSVSATMTATAINGFVVQASTSLIVNEGDIGKVIKELSSNDSIKSLATNVATPGLTNGISNQLGFEHKDVAKLSFQEHLKQAARENTVGAVCNTAASSAIQGSSVGENALNAVRSAAVDTAAEGVAHGIGNLYHGDSSKAEMPTAAASASTASTSTASTSTSQTASKIDPVTHKILHGGLGAAAAAAAKGQSALLFNFIKNGKNILILIKACIFHYEFDQRNHSSRRLHKIYLFLSQHHIGGSLLLLFHKH